MAKAIECFEVIVINQNDVTDWVEGNDLEFTPDAADIGNNEIMANIAQGMVEYLVECGAYDDAMRFVLTNMGIVKEVEDIEDDVFLNDSDILAGLIEIF